jgi:uncharacterized protein (DUF885 family)
MLLTTVLMAAVESSIVQPLAESYLAELWRSAPTSASQAGYHKDGVDARLDDASEAARQRRIAFLRRFGAELDATIGKVRATHGREDEADAALLRDSIELELNELEETQSFRRRCDTPLDGLGQVFFFMTTRRYAPALQRLSDTIARLKEVPRYLGQVQAALTEDVDVFRDAAKDDGAGLIEYLQKDLIELWSAEAKADPKLTAQLAALRVEAAAAVQAVKAYLSFLEHELPKKSKGSWRLGAERYAKRFRPYLQTDLAPQQVLAQAEKRLSELHVEMGALAGQITGVKVRDTTRESTIKRALDLIAKDHPAPEALFATVRQDLADATAFVAERRLLTLEGRKNLQVVETPPFLRSQLGVAAFDGAPPLQPELGAFFYVTPFPKSWSAAQVESKLREYNRFMLDLLTIHEAMPGHYVQFEHANQVQPEWRRVLRWVVGAGSYMEGWAVYAQDLMVDAGFRDRDPRLRLQARKMELRAVANTILDIKLHTGDMTDEAAMKLMTVDAFQERAEAEAKLRRAKLSVTQLCSYFVGGEAWKLIRGDAEAHAKQAGKQMDLRTFHDRALDLGPVTLPFLRDYMRRAPQSAKP